VFSYSSLYQCFCFLLRIVSVFRFFTSEVDVRVASTLARKGFEVCLRWLHCVLLLHTLYTLLYFTTEVYLRKHTMHATVLYY